MITRFHKVLRKIRKSMSRIEWVAKLLGHPVCPPAYTTHPGLVLLQIDGLARTQFERALRQGRMPFLKHLAEQQGYVLTDMYAGVPSTTPAVQAELFFGVRAAVPSFQFVHRQSGEQFAMYSPRGANTMAAILEEKGNTPLLKGGTSYSNIYAGGAEEARFCAQSLNLESFLRAAHPLNVLLVLLLHSGKYLRVLGYTGIELGLAVFDFFGGIIERKNFFKELTFIPKRIGVCAGLREIIRFRVKLDITRGMPVICASFLGYDEQAHRRGPGSTFAHWSLKGIDGTIKDIFRTALRSDCREYQVIIYSDHGQEATVSYSSQHDRDIQHAVRGVLAGWMSPDQVEETQISAMGPVGHVYLPEPLPPQDLRSLACQLVERAKIPLVLFRGETGAVAVNREGEFDPRRAPEPVLGADHPFLQQAAEDLAALCDHPDAGDLILSGWFPGAPPMTFPVENGAHGGPGKEETRGFLLLPPFMKTGKTVLRPLDLRHIALSFLRNRKPERIPVPLKDKLSLRTISYNIHSCICMDGKISPERIARILDWYQPDLVALQEVDVDKKRTGYRDQAQWIADYLEMNHFFFPVVTRNGEKYGIAVLSRFPFIDIKNSWLPSLPPANRRERRGVIQARIDTPYGILHFLNTHLGLHVKERQRQVQELLGPGWLGSIPPDEAVIFCGDFNAGPRSVVYRELTRRLRDTQTECTTPRMHTFFSGNPFLCLDHIFISPHFTPLTVEVPKTQDVKMASDHLPLIADLRLDSGHQAQVRQKDLHKVRINDYLQK